VRAHGRAARARPPHQLGSLKPWVCWPPPKPRVELSVTRCCHVCPWLAAFLRAPALMLCACALRHLNAWCVNKLRCSHSKSSVAICKQFMGRVCVEL
jgi:hypothetical protein